jgi:hypothetical protein
MSGPSTEHPTRPLSEADKARHLKVLQDHRTGGDGCCIVCYPVQAAPCSWVRESRQVLTAAGVPLGQWIEAPWAVGDPPATEG